MAIRTREEILESIRNIVGDSTDDNTLQVLEDVTDTFTDFENKTANQTDWEAKYKKTMRVGEKNMLSVFTLVTQASPPKTMNQLLTNQTTNPHVLKSYLQQSKGE